MKKITSKSKIWILAMSLVASFVTASQSEAATTYTINLRVIDSDSATNIALYDDSGDQSASHGVKECSDSKVMWINRNASRASDIMKFTKVGNRTKIKVKNDSGKVVGLGTLSKVSWLQDREEMDDDPEIGLVVFGTCIYSQKIKVKASDFYSIEISGLDAEPFDVSLASLKKKKWNLTLTI